MEEIKLDVQTRDQIGRRKAKSVRQIGFIPAVIYGGKKASTPVKVKQQEYEHIMRLYKGQNVVFHLNVMEGDKKLKDYSAIVKEEQRAPVLDDLLHIDFHRISLTEEIEVKVPIKTKGVAIGVKEGGGSLDHALWELNIICLPTNIPSKIEIDVTNLKIGDAIHLREISLPADVRTKHDPETILVSVVPPMKEEPIEKLAEEGAKIEPEVIREKKKEKEETAEDQPEQKSKEQKPKE